MPVHSPYDAIIVGGGFAGCLLAQVLVKHGWKVLLVDRQRHPRFAVGESSTPIADLLLERLADQYQLPHLRPLARYGTWQRSLPQLTCGPKRGFSYFAHAKNRTFTDSVCHENAMLVAASRDLEVSDTHWLRSDVDGYLFQTALDQGATFVCGDVAAVRVSDAEVTIDIVTAGDPSVDRFHGNFLVDATGGNRALATMLGIGDQSNQLLTSSRTTYCHLQDLASWDQWLEQHGLPISDHPFPSDQAAQHHLLEDGWIWMLRFDNGITSVGWTRPTASRQGRGTQVNVPDFDPIPQSLLTQLGVADYPSLASCLGNAKLVGPREGPVHSGRLQRLATSVVGPRFALLPTAAATIDPLHSSGIAHGMSGVFRLAEILTTAETSGDRYRQLQQYEQHVLAEAKLLDHLVAGCYAAGNRLELFADHASWYFLAAIHTEEAIADGRPWPALWLAHDDTFVAAVKNSTQRLHALTRQSKHDETISKENRRWTRAAIAPWNHVELLNPELNNMTPYTVAPK